MEPVLAPQEGAPNTPAKASPPPQERVSRRGRLLGYTKGGRLVYGAPELKLGI